MGTYKLGPCLAYLGDPTQASGAGMQFLGHIRGETTVNPNINISTGRVDAKGMMPLADTLFNSGPQPVANVPLVDEQKEKLKELLPGSSIVSDGGDGALLLGSGVQRIAVSEIGTLCLIPVDEVDQGTNGIDAPNAWWFPRAICTDFGSITFALPEGDDNLSTFARDTVLTSLYHDVDQADSNIPKDARPGFRGAPSEAGITGWSLPDHSTNL
ncbi:hypothetical protein [Fodinibius sp.]|uniref:hypothetical protein n=1 Tax=Fodinibius sp. TaxID=1872440 RepID=UPI002ACD2E1A|nr:hypothetical protein [Fodinibius sp.]MDZ7658088.1 hypothetical protein [Fodinibius sp.]